MDENIPKLIEPGVKYFIRGTLKECKKFKEIYYNYIYNIVTVILIIICLGLFLLYRYKGKISQEEIDRKNIEKQEYIISKLQQLSNIKENASKKYNMITNLPLLNE